jgi:hypothetical protein
MGTRNSRDDNYYFQCVMEANQEANAPFGTAEIGDYSKVKVVEDINGISTVRGMAYEVINIEGELITLSPLPLPLQTDYMRPHSLQDLTEDDFMGTRVVERDNIILFKRVNTDVYMDFLRIQKRAYGTVNQDGLWGDRNRLVTNEVQT